jgi:hypothetical protein
MSWDTPLPADEANGELTSASEKLYHHKTGSASNAGAKDGDIAKLSNGTTSKEAYHWVLTPRGDHAALNSGIRSLAEKDEVVLIAWPVDVRDIHGTKIGAGTLTQEERKELEAGFNKLALKDEKKGTRCVPVWMDDKVRLSCLFIHTLFIKVY